MCTFSCLQFNPVKDHTHLPPNQVKGISLLQEKSVLTQRPGRLSAGVYNFEYQIKVFELRYFGNKKKIKDILAGVEFCA